MLCVLKALLCLPKASYPRESTDSLHLHSFVILYCNQMIVQVNGEDAVLSGEKGKWRQAKFLRKSLYDGVCCIPLKCPQTQALLLSALWSSQTGNGLRCASTDWLFSQCCWPFLGVQTAQRLQIIRSFQTTREDLKTQFAASTIIPKSRIQLWGRNSTNTQLIYLHILFYFSRKNFIDPDSILFFFYEIPLKLFGSISAKASEIDSKILITKP